MGPSEQKTDAETCRYLCRLLSLRSTGFDIERMAQKDYTYIHLIRESFISKHYHHFSSTKRSFLSCHKCIYVHNMRNQAWGTSIGTLWMRKKYFPFPKILHILSPSTSTSIAGNNFAFV